MKKLCIFGNGLGMGVCPESYNLTKVMADVWQSDFIDQEQKKLILACLPNDVHRPSSEEQLATLQRVVGACEVLKRIPQAAVGHWLSDHGMSFPEAVQRFSFLVARSMHLATYPDGDLKGKPCRLPDEFIFPLFESIKDGQVHIATLNYDGLLSNFLTDKKLLGDNGLETGGGQNTLLDGFKDKKFDRSHMFRQKNKGAWYMHLHGCPLFSDRQRSKPYRLSTESISTNISKLKNVGRHIVLTHFDHKPEIISSSEILTVYWEFFERSIEESDEIIIFGYSGNDVHVNRMIAQLGANKRIRIIEWIGAGTKARRKEFWSDQVSSSAEIIQMDDVLAFTDW